jgi:hypothetical protein
VARVGTGAMRTRFMTRGRSEEPLFSLCHCNPTPVARNVRISKKKRKSEKKKRRRTNRCTTSSTPKRCAKAKGVYPDDDAHHISHNIAHTIMSTYTITYKTRSIEVILIIDTSTHIHTQIHTHTHTHTHTTYSEIVGVENGYAGD